MRPLVILRHAWQARRTGNLRPYLTRGFWNSVSRLGERIGSPALTYNRGIFRFFHEKAKENAPGFARVLRRHFPDARSVVDLGCGTGAYLHELAKQGLRVAGMEYSPRGRRTAKEEFGLHVRPFDLNRPVAVGDVGGPFDLALTVEVGEHLPEFMGENLVISLCRLADTVVFTAAQPGDGGTAHINEQPSSYWIARFRKHGFTLDAEATTRLSDDVKASPDIKATFLWKNVLVFRRLPGHRAPPEVRA